MDKKSKVKSEKFIMRPVEVVVDEIIQQLDGRKRISLLLMPIEKEGHLVENRNLAAGRPGK